MKSSIALAAAAAVSIAAFAAPALAQADGQVLMADMNGAKEKPTPGDSKATGMAHVTVNEAKNQVCWHMTVQNLAQPTMAHIHKAGPNDAGPVAVALTPPDANGQSQGCATVEPALAKDLVQNPGAYYVNVHSAEFKAGAIRGQLAK